MSPHPQLTPHILAGIVRLETQSDTVLQLGLEMMKADSGGLYQMDLLAMAVIKRHLSTAAAIVQLIRDWNMVTARALLRVQIDTVLRFSGAWLVESPDAFAEQVRKGVRIDKIKDRAGHPLTDRHLVEIHSKHFPWLPETYRRLSGFVHLSDEHIFASFTEAIDDSFRLELGATDEHLPESSWVEIIDCFVEVSEHLLLMLRDWIARKQRGATPLGTPPKVC